MTFVPRQPYELVTGPPRVPWEGYILHVREAWNALLASDPEEKTVQAFLERHPALLPGSHGMTLTGGRTCFPPAVIAQPVLSGLAKKIPDFMWITESSDTIFPVLIEIEKPGKRWYKSDGDPTSALTHARQQLAGWRDWFRNPTNEQWFRDYYELTNRIWRNRSLRPAFVLIYGRRSEFEDKPDLNRIRAELSGENEHYMTYDRLELDRSSSDYVTCRKATAHGFEVVAVPATLAWGPVHMEEYVRMTGWERAISNCEYIPDDRRNFLLARYAYWKTWALSPGNATIRAESE